MSDVLPEENDAPAVLVVDDNLLIVKQVIQVLSPQGLTCHWARSCEEARRTLVLNRIDLVIADIRHPSMNGIELAQWMRGPGNFKDIPVLFFTAACDRATIEAAANIPHIDYLLRPLRPAQFSARVLKNIRALHPND